MLRNFPSIPLWYFQFLPYEPQGAVQGNQSPGEMKFRFDRFQSVQGYEGMLSLYTSSCFRFLINTNFGIKIGTRIWTSRSIYIAKSGYWF